MKEKLFLKKIWNEICLKCFFSHENQMTNQIWSNFDFVVSLLFQMIRASSIVSLFLQNKFRLENLCLSEIDQFFHSRIILVEYLIVHTHLSEIRLRKLIWVKLDCGRPFEWNSIKEIHLSENRLGIYFWVEFNWGCRFGWNSIKKVHLIGILDLKIDRKCIFESNSIEKVYLSEIQ